MAQKCPGTFVGANEEDDAMLEAIFVECTCYKPAGSLTPEDRETVTNDVTEELMKVSAVLTGLSTWTGHLLRLPRPVQEQLLEHFL